MTTSIASSLHKNVTLEKAEVWQADLIAIDSQGQSTLLRLLLGSASNVWLSLPMFGDDCKG